MMSRTQEEITAKWPKEWSIPVVCIRCTTYNHESYIAQALDGFIMQETDFPFEVIVHDDASTDKTADIIREYAAKYPKIIKPIYETENQYSKKDNSLRKIMDNACKGEFMAICEGDDYWIDPLKLQKQVDYLRAHPKCSLVRTEINRLYQKTGFVEKCFFTKIKKENNRDTLEDYIWNAWFAAPCTWLYRSDIPPRPSLNGKKYFIGDILMLLNFASFGDIHFMPDVTAVYRILDNSASHFKRPIDSYRFWCLVKNTRKYYAKRMPFLFQLKFFFFVKRQHIHAMKALICASLKRLLK